MGFVHIFAGNPLDRGDAQRRDPDWLDAAARSPLARFLPFWKGNLLVEEFPEGIRLGWLLARDLEPLDVDTPPVFLGLDGNVPCFGQDLTTVLTAEDEIDLVGGMRFTDARGAAMGLPQGDTGIVAQARAQISWHRSHRYCSACGAETTPEKGGLQRRCTDCDASHFPRTDPVVIMLITDGDRCLLGQSHGPLVRIGMWSALAGFMDQGEAIEEAVRRECREEAGIRVGEVRYHSSQPWPFPSSLMIGCHGKAETTDITIDEEEMHDVRWFEREVVAAAFAGDHPTLKLPGPIAIAHHLIRAWLEGEVD